MKQLQQLVSTYLIGFIDFEQFRDAFLRGFLTEQNSDIRVATAINAIECASDDFSENVISASTFRSRLVGILPSPASEIFDSINIVIAPPQSATAHPRPSESLPTSSAPEANAELYLV